MFFTSRRAAVAPLLELKVVFYGYRTAVMLISSVGIYSCLRQRMNLLFCYSMMGYVLALVELLFFLTLYIHLGRVRF